MKSTRVSIAVIVATGLAVALPGSALAAGPTASTGGANAVTATSATLNGSANPNHNATTTHFEYGTTTAYSARTPDAPTNAAKGKQPASATVTGLAPLTTYHYRLVAVSNGGNATGNDRTFRTPAAPPNSATIAPSPGTMVFGRTTVISGQVTGPQNAGITVTLQQTPAPYTARFRNAGTTTTDNAGRYSFTVGPQVNTRYQVSAKTKPQVTSAVTQVRVRFAIAMATKGKRVRGGKRVTFSGVVKPAFDGGTVLIERRGKDRKFHTVARTLLAHSTVVGQSTYSKRIRVTRTGVFRTRVVHDTTHADGISSARRIRVG